MTRQPNRRAFLKQTMGAGLAACALAKEGVSSTLLLQERPWQPGITILFQGDSITDSVVVKIFTLPAEHWAADGVHPTPAGSYLMAQAWLETVKRSR